MSSTRYIREDEREGRILITEEYMKVIFEKFFARLALYATGIVGEDGLASDVVANVMVRLWEDRRKLSFKDETALKNYLYIGTKMEAIGFLRRGKTEKNAMEGYRRWESDTTNPYTVTQVEAVAFLMEAVTLLPMQYRKTIEMVITGHSNEDIARIMGIKESSVRSNIARGVALLRKKFVGNLDVAMMMSLGLIGNETAFNCVRSIHHIY